MEEIVKLLNELVEKNLIKNYAVGGSIGMSFYTEPLVTFDVDVFVDVAGVEISSFDLIYDFFKEKGYEFKGQHLLVEGIYLDILPPPSALVKEAVEEAQNLTYGGEGVNVFRPEYLIAIALETNRPVDYKKIDLLLTEADLDNPLLISLLKKFNLYERFVKYVGK